MNKTQKGISTKINNSKNLNLIINSDTYKLAHEDIGLLNRNEMRGVRMLLEITKPDLILEENKILSTIIIFGGASIAEESKTKEKIAGLQDSQAEVFEEVKDRIPQEATSGDIKNALKIGDRSALRSLRALERKGLLISETRRTDKGRCVVFKISPTTVLTD